MLDLIKEEYEALKQRLAIKQQYAHVFETPEGQLVLHDILRMAGLASNGFDANPNTMAYNEGRRAVALHILSRLRLENERAAADLINMRAAKDMPNLNNLFERTTN